VAGIVGRVQQIRARSTVILTGDNIAHDRAKLEIHRFALDQLALWRFHACGFVFRWAWLMAAM